MVPFAIPDPRASYELKKSKSLCLEEIDAVGDAGPIRFSATAEDKANNRGGRPSGRTSSTLRQGLEQMVENEAPFSFPSIDEENNGAKPTTRGDRYNATTVDENRSQIIEDYASTESTASATSRRNEKRHTVLQARKNAIASMRLCLH